MTTEATIKTGDTGRTLGAYLTEGDGQAIDLTGCTVEVRMRPRGSTLATVSGPCTVVGSATDGHVSFSDWDAGDLDEPVVLQVEFKVTDDADQVVTVPSDSYLTLRVLQSIDLT